MEDCITVNVHGDILSIPIADLSRPELYRWWMQPPPGSSGDANYARAKAAWELFSVYTGRPLRLKPIRKSGFQFWLRCKLTKLGVI